MLKAPEGKIIEINDTDTKATAIPQKLKDKETDNKDGTAKEEMEDLAENEELIRDWLEESV